LDFDLSASFGEDVGTPSNGVFQTKEKIDMKTAHLALAAATLATLSPAAFAAEPSRTVRYADLNLANPEGRAQLDRRIASAAGALCGFAHSADLAAQSAVARCRAATLAGVTGQRNAVLASAPQGGMIRMTAR
jgi:UrcA family protein